MTDQLHRDSEDPRADEREAETEPSRPPRPSQAEGEEPGAEETGGSERPPRPSQAEGER
jgi:hypothetical protein